MKKIWEDKLLRADLLLFLLFLAYCGTVILRVNIEGTGYTSPDSEYYLEAARSLRDGEKFVIRDLYGLHTGVVNKLTPFTAWPIGYPTIIFGTSFVSGLNLFWASKAVNLFFVGLGFILLRHINREYSFILASVYGSFTVIEIYSYTWSEGIFIFWCLCISFILFNAYQTSKFSGLDALILCTTLCGMFLTRYIAIYAYLVTFTYVLYLYWNKRYTIANKMLLSLSIASAFSLGYLLRNYSLIGHATGISRLHTDMESPIEVIWMSVKALIIEIFVIRKYYLSGTPNLLFIGTFTLQLIVMVYIYTLVRKQKYLVILEFKKNLLSHIAIITAFAYLIVLVVLRSISQFDPPNYRLLSPFSFLILFALVNYIIALSPRIEGATKAKYVLGGFFLISLLLNLPKKFLFSYLF